MFLCFLFLRIDKRVCELSVELLNSEKILALVEVQNQTQIYSLRVISNTIQIELNVRQKISKETRKRLSSTDEKLKTI